MTEFDGKLDAWLNKDNDDENEDACPYCEMWPCDCEPDYEQIANDNYEHRNS